MPTLTELQEKRGTLVTQARDALNAINANTDESRTAELEQRHDTIMADYDKLEKDIEREARVAQIEKAAEEHRAKQRPLGDDGETRAQDLGGNGGGDASGAAAEYRAAFNAYLREGCDIGAVSEEQRSLLRRGYDAEIRKRNRFGRR